MKYKKINKVTITAGSSLGKFVTNDEEIMATENM
jgi:hypothetical protein